METQIVEWLERYQLIFAIVYSSLMGCLCFYWMMYKPMLRTAARMIYAERENLQRYKSALADVLKDNEHLREKIRELKQQTTDGDEWKWA